MGEITRFGRYLKESGTTHKWLAQRVGTSPETMSRWIHGAVGMSEENQDKVMAVLRERAAMDLDDLFEDQHTPWERWRGRSGTPYDQLMREQQ